MRTDWYSGVFRLDWEASLRVRVKSTNNRDNISMAQCKTAVTPSLTQWSYCSLVLSHWYNSTRTVSIILGMYCSLKLGMYFCKLLFQISVIYSGLAFGAGCLVMFIPIIILAVKLQRWEHSGLIITLQSSTSPPPSSSQCHRQYLQYHHHCIKLMKLSLLIIGLLTNDKAILIEVTEQNTEKK